jgi:hypothetical protein
MISPVANTTLSSVSQKLTIYPQFESLITALGTAMTDFNIQTASSNSLYSS